MLEPILAIAEILKHPYSLLTAIVWVTYWYSLRTGFVSDDHQGIGDYDGKLQGLEYGMVSRWIRFHLAGGNYPSKNKFPDGKPIPMGKLPFIHHSYNIILLNILVLLGYTFLASLFGSKVAFITMAFFTVSPVGTQCIAWCSGLGYPLSLMWIFLILNYVQAVEFSLVSFLVFVILDILAVNALFVALGLPAILLFLGHYEYAAVGCLVSLALGFQIVRHTIKIRADEFKKQDMGKLTQFTPRRVVLAMKTLMYYFELICWPNKLGLYHEWGNHPSADHGRVDKRFFMSLIAVLGLVVIFFLSPNQAVRLGILWFFSFIFIFLNWITIQQFVTERYLWIPSVGFYLIVASTLQDYQHLLYLIGGILLCRTWLHLPTYDDELRFYLSNTWNFQNSEIAYANLGCTWIRLGAVGSALDSWHASSKANPDYDVPYANIYFNHRASAMMSAEHGNYMDAIEKLKLGFHYIDACCKCTVRHFKDDWQKEYNLVKAWIENPLMLVVSEKKRLTNLKATLEARLAANDPDKAGVQLSLDHIATRMLHIEELLRQAPPDKIPKYEDVPATEITLPGQSTK